MSSDSGESHSSAHSDHGGEIGLGEGADTVEEGVTGNHAAHEADGEELESMGSGAEGLTFARTRRSFPQQDEGETASELSMRPRVERPGSPESTSTPDDTPSIQVRAERVIP